MEVEPVCKKPCTDTSCVIPLDLTTPETSSYVDEAGYFDETLIYELADEHVHLIDDIAVVPVVPTNRSYEEEVSNLELLLSWFEMCLEDVQNNISCMHKKLPIPRPDLMCESLLVDLQNKVMPLLRTLLTQVTLSMDYIHRLESVEVHAVRIKEQLELFRVEVTAMLSESSVVSIKKGGNIVKAVFVRQPRSQIIKRVKKLSQSVGKKSQLCLEILVVAGALTVFDPDLSSLSVTLSLVEETRAGTLELDLNIADCNWAPETSTLAVSTICCEGTQLTPAFLKISLRGKVCGPLVGVNGSIDAEIVALSSNPLVIITNSTQWKAAEGRLMRYCLSGNRFDLSIPWAFVSNVIMDMFVRATHQNLTYTEVSPPLNNQYLRALSQSDVSFIHKQKFQGKSNVSCEDFFVFWKWFGPICEQYHKDKLLRTVFLQGLIFDLIRKEDCIAVLHRMEAGAFLIRSSESSQCGEYALAYVDSLNQVRHYKIAQTKLKPPFGNLADFVHDKELLKKVITSSNFQIDKMEAFAEFFSIQEDCIDEQYTLRIY